MRSRFVGRASCRTWPLCSSSPIKADVAPDRSASRPAMTSSTTNTASRAASRSRRRNSLPPMAAERSRRCPIAAPASCACSGPRRRPRSDRCGWRVRRSPRITEVISGATACRASRRPCLRSAPSCPSSPRAQSAVWRSSAAPRRVDRWRSCSHVRCCCAAALGGEDQWFTQLTQPSMKRSVARNEPAASAARFARASR
jgi:hypothetical protein